MADPVDLPSRAGHHPGRRPGSTGSATAPAGSSTSARRRACAAGSTPTSPTCGRCTSAPSRWSPPPVGVDWVTVGTEVEALQLEYTWIKEYDPRFNVRYRDDKSYPYLAVTLDEEYPRLQVMRGAKRKGVRYFGPYSHAWAIRETLDLLLRVFPARTCSRRRVQAGRPDRPALPARLHRQVLGAVRRPGHRRASTARIVEDFCDFMAGRTDTHGAPARAGDAEAARRSWSSSGPPGCATTWPRCAGRWRSRPSCSATAPTPTWSPSPRTSSRPPSRSSTSAAAGSAASAAGWWRRPRS